jgi:transposase-like protein
MEEKADGGKKVRRIFTAEQKFEILKDIERCKTIKEGLAKHHLAQSVYHKWKRQLEVGVRASLRNGRPVKSTDLKRLGSREPQAQGGVTEPGLLISELKKEMNLDY